MAVYHLQSGKHESVGRSLIPVLSAIDLNVLSKRILIGETSRIKAAKTLLESHPIN